MAMVDMAVTPAIIPAEMEIIRVPIRATIPEAITLAVFLVATEPIPETVPNRAKTSTPDQVTNTLPMCPRKQKCWTVQTALVIFNGRKKR